MAKRTAGETESQQADAKRKKVPSACLFCRRSHMVCSADRPCERCIRRGIAHLCTTESDQQQQQPGAAAGGSTSKSVGEDSSSGSGSGSEEGGARPVARMDETDLAAAPTSGRVDPPSSRVDKHTPPQQHPRAPVPELSSASGQVLRPPLLQRTSSSSIPLTQSYSSNPPLDPQSSFPRDGLNPVSNAHLLSLAATPPLQTPIHSPSWPALPPSFGLESIQAHPPLSTTTAHDQHPSTEWASLSSFIDSLDFPPGLFTPDVRSPSAHHQEDSGADREAYATFLEQLRLKQTQLAASRPGSPRTQAFTHASSSFLQLPPQFAAQDSPAAAAVRANVSQQVVPSKREFMDLLQSMFEGAQLAGGGEIWDWEGGWTALDVWLESCSEKNRERVYSPLRIFRPAVKGIVENMSNEDKMLVEEGFQRLVLQYDRVFTVVKTPSCLWRRTGQIFKANTEFSQLMGMEMSWFRDGKLGIYELMTEEAGVNFWEQYCSIGFDQSRKAVLTTCTLTPPARLLRKKSSSAKPGSTSSGKQINCCFSFTVTRDGWGVPMGIMGNFLQIGG